VDEIRINKNSTGIAFNPMLKALKADLINKLWKALSPERQKALARPLLPVQLPDLYSISCSWVHKASDALKLYNIEITASD
jgi:hypothetical protein